MKLDQLIRVGDVHARLARPCDEARIDAHRPHLDEIVEVAAYPSAAQRLDVSAGQADRARLDQSIGID